eukprot:jgi/Tetstr1/455774/TSEL_042571.t1
MTFFGKLGHTFKAFGSKVAGAASYLGHKVGSGLMTLAPAISVLSPTVGAGFAAAGAAAQGIGVLGDVGKKALSGGGVDFGQRKAAYGPSTAPDWEIGNVELQLEFVETDLNAAASKSVTSRPTCGLKNWYYSVSGENIPQTPVRENVESFAELQKALHVFGSADNKLHFHPSPITRARRAAPPINAFAIGQNLEVLSHKSTLTESGQEHPQHQLLLARKRDHWKRRVPD